MKEDVHYFRLVELRNKRYVHEREKSVEMLVSFFVNTMKKVAIVVSSIVLSNLLSNGFEDVALSACGESVYLYKKLGLQSYLIISL